MTKHPRSKHRQGKHVAALVFAAALLPATVSAQNGEAKPPVPKPPVTVPATPETREVTVIPVEQESYHVPVFRNEYGILMRVNIPAGRDTQYHIHTLPQISVIIEQYPPDAYSQNLGEDRGVASGAQIGDTVFRSYESQPRHRAVNPGRYPMHFIALVLTKPEPHGFRPGAREVFGYTEEFDLPRARAWRLKLNPGETAPPIKQEAPGFRVVVNNDAEIAEIEAGKRDRFIYLRKGDFYWQEPGQTRAIRNVGKTPLYIVEVELK